MPANLLPFGRTPITPYMPVVRAPQYCAGKTDSRATLAQSQIRLKLWGSRNFTMGIVSTFLNNVLYLAHHKKPTQYVDE